MEKGIQALIKDEEKLRKIRQENLAQKRKRDQLVQATREMIEKEAELSRLKQREIYLQTAKQLQLEENARAARLEIKQIAEMDRLMEVINKKSGKLKGKLMTEISQPCPCCNAEKHQATVNSCIKVTKVMQQEKLIKTPFIVSV